MSLRLDRSESSQNSTRRAVKSSPISRGIYEPSCRAWEISVTKSTSSPLSPPFLADLEFPSFRAPKSPLDSTIITAAPTPATGFIDGTFIEKFSELSNEAMDKVLAGASEFEKIELTREELIGMVEEVGRMH